MPAINHENSVYYILTIIKNIGSAIERNCKDTGVSIIEKNERKNVDFNRMIS